VTTLSRLKKLVRNILEKELLLIGHIYAFKSMSCDSTVSCMTVGDFTPLKFFEFVGTRCSRIYPLILIVTPRDRIVNRTEHCFY